MAENNNQEQPNRQDTRPDDENAPDRSNDANNQATPPALAKTKSKCYRSLKAGMSILYGKPESDNPLAQRKSVRFIPFFDHYRNTGERFRVGFLETNIKEVQERLAKDVDVEAISAKEYKEFTEKLERAPY